MVHLTQSLCTYYKLKWHQLMDTLSFSRQREFESNRIESNLIANRAFVRSDINIRNKPNRIRSIQIEKSFEIYYIFEESARLLVSRIIIVFIREEMIIVV